MWNYGLIANLSKVFLLQPSYRFRFPSQLPTFKRSPPPARLPCCMLHPVLYRFTHLGNRCLFDYWSVAVVNTAGSCTNAAVLITRSSTNLFVSGFNPSLLLHESFSWGACCLRSRRTPAHKGSDRKARNQRT